MNDNLRTLVRRPWRDLSLPPDATGIPTMLSKLERRLLYSLARDYAGEGAIVDAGSFLGGSTAALLAGVRDRPERWSGPPVASYDLFQVDEYMVPKFFADDRSVQLRDFFPSLVPGRSVIVHQDYGWGDTPWIPVTVELMRESLVLLDWMEWGTHVFFVAEELPAELLGHGVAGLDLDRKVQLLEDAAGRAEGWVLGMLEISRALLIADRDGPDAALAELDAIAARHSQRGFVLACAEQVSRQIADVVQPR